MSFSDYCLINFHTGEKHGQDGARSSDEMAVGEDPFYDSTPCDPDLLLQRAKTEKMKSKIVYYCARHQKSKPARRPMDKRRGPVRSKKDVCCRYAAWLVVFESEPDSKYFIEIKGHTGHNPWENPEEVRWLRTEKFVEEEVENLVGLIPPSQILDKLQDGVPATGYSNPYSRLTIEKIEAIRKKWLRRNRVQADDRLSVLKMTEDKKFPCLFHEQQEDKITGESRFHSGISSDFQAAMLKKFGDVVYLDTVHGMTKYGFLQLTMLVMDEFGHGCPVAFSMLGPSERCEDWVQLIEKAFQKAERDPKSTVFMIDNSSVMKAAVNQVVLGGTGGFVLCAFHMMQDINRRLSRHIKYTGKKGYNAERNRILGMVKGLRLLNNKDSFYAESGKFKHYISKSKAIRGSREFITYYEKNWEKCASKWANFGRKHISHHEQNTNNLIESFFCQLRYRFCRGKRFKRLDEHFNILVSKVIPKYIRDRCNRVNGIELGHRQVVNRRTEKNVVSLLENATIRTMHDVFGYGRITMEEEEHFFSLSDLSCTCSNSQFGDVCIHIEAAHRHLGEYSFERLSRARDIIQKNISEFINKKGQEHAEDLLPSQQGKDIDCVLEFKPIAVFLRNHGTRLRPIITNIDRHHCSCSMFARAERCCHLTPILDEDRAIPEHVFRVRRFDCHQSPENDPCNKFSNECNYQCNLSATMVEKDPRCLGFLTRATKKCRHISQIDIDDECCRRLQQILDWLEIVQPSGYDVTFTEEDVQKEISLGYSRRVSDRIQKPLYSSSSSSSRKRSRTGQF